LPEDYELCFSEYTAVVADYQDDNESYFVVVDMPIIGIVKNDDNKEIRFYTSKSHKDAIDEIEKNECRLLE